MNPIDLRHITLMNDVQREAWIKGMDKLKADGKLSRFSKFRLPRAQKRGGDPEAPADLF